MSSYNKQKFKQFKELYFQLLTRKNKEDNSHYNGIIQRYLSVSYTHLDVYKRQVQLSLLLKKEQQEKSE